MKGGWGEGGEKEEGGQKEEEDDDLLEGCYSVSAYDGDEEGRREKLL